MDIHVTKLNEASGSILVSDMDREETKLSNIPNEIAVLAQLAIKYGLPMDSLQDLREEMFEVWRAVLDANGYSPETIGKLINQVKRSYL